MEESKNSSYGYSKRPLWQWIAIYLVIAGVLYTAIYYYFFRNKGGYSYSTPAAVTNSAAEKNAVQIANFKYTSDSLTVKVGDTVRWINQDTAAHSATADDASFDTGLLAQGTSGSITFSKAGTFTYHCSAHPNMHGTVIVQ